MQFKNHEHYNCEIELDTGEKYRVAANWIHNSDLDHWQGWSCDAGYKRLSIDSDFNVHSAECHNQNLGNLFAGWSLNPTSQICQRNRCTGCTDDLLLAKHRI